MSNTFTGEMQVSASWNGRSWDWFAEIRIPAGSMAEAEWVAASIRKGGYSVLCDSLPPSTPTEIQPHPAACARCRSLTLPASAGRRTSARKRKSKT